MALTDPQWLGGYRLLNRLGAGGTGTVWEAVDEGGGRVALKTLHPALAQSEESRRRLLREARLVNQVQGQGIARVLDVEADDAAPFMATELVEGPTLAQIVAQDPLTTDECLHLAVQLEDILHRVHAAGIVHRDLKPSNIIISDTGPVLIDFGIAQGSGDERLTQTGKITGTPGYVSPEILRDDRSADFDRWRAGDWWAWSALLLSSLTGEPPFGTGPIEAVVTRVFEGKAQVTSLPGPIREIFVNALRPDPAQRLDPWQVIEALRQVSLETEPAGDLTEVLTKTLVPETQVIPSAAAPTLEPTARLDPVPPHPVTQPYPSVSPMPASYPAEPWHPNQMGMYPGPYPYVPPPYASPPISTYPIAFMVLAAVLALLPAAAGPSGLVMAGAALLAFGTLGEAYHWRERRRIQYGSTRRSDGTLSALRLPLHLLLATLQIMPGMALGLAVALGGWFLTDGLQSGTDFTLDSLFMWFGNGDMALPTAWIWLLSVSASLIALVFPAAKVLRTGVQLSVRTTLPKSGVRVGVYAALCVLVAVLLLVLT